MKDGKKLSGSSFEERLEGKMANVNGTVDRVQSEFGEKPPCRDSFDYYVIVLKDCDIETDDGEKFWRDALKVRCSKSRYEDCKDFLEKSRKISLRGKEKREGEEIQELTRLEKRGRDFTEGAKLKPKTPEREPTQSIKKSTRETSKKQAKKEKWPDMPPPPRFKEDFEKEMRNALKGGKHRRIPYPFSRRYQKSSQFGLDWDKGKETPMFRKAKDKLLEAEMTPYKYATMDLMASRWSPKRDPRNLQKFDGVGLDELCDKIKHFHRYPSSVDVIEDVLKPLGRRGFIKVFKPPKAEKRDAITKKGLRFLYPKIPGGKDKNGRKKVTTGLIHRLRICAGARVLARKGFFFYPVFHWVRKHEFGEWSEPDGFAIPPGGSKGSVEYGWNWSRALWVEVLGEPIRPEKIRENVEKNMKQNRRTLFLTTSLKNGKKIAEESRSVLKKKTPQTSKGVAEGLVTVGLGKIAPRDYVIIQPIPPLLPGLVEKGEFKNFQQKRKIAKAVADGREVKISNVDEEDYLKTEGIGERWGERVEIKKPDGQWTTMGTSDIVIEGFIKSIKEGKIDPKEWADAKAPRRWFVDAFLLERSKRRGNFGGRTGDETQIGNLTFDRDEVEKDYIRLKDGNMDFNRHVYRKYQTISENRGV